MPLDPQTAEAVAAQLQAAGMEDDEIVGRIRAYSQGWEDPEIDHLVTGRRIAPEDAGDPRGSGPIPRQPLNVRADPMAGIKSMGLPATAPRGTGAPDYASEYRAFLPQDIDGLPIDNDGEAASPQERFAIMNVGMSNDDIEKMYREAGMETVRDRIGRVHLIDSARGVAVPIINDERAKASDMALPVGLSLASLAAGGPAGAEAGGGRLMEPIRWAGRSVLGRALKAGGAQFIGEEAFRGGMRAATGKPVPMDPAGAGMRAGMTAGVQAAMEGGGRAIASSGGVSPRVSNETMRAGPIEKARRISPFGFGAYRAGEASPEMEVGKSILGSIGKRMGETSASRQAADQIVAEATKQKIKIPIRDFMVALSKRAAKMPLGKPEKLEARRLDELWHDIAESYLRPRWGNGQPKPQAAIKDWVTPQEAETIRATLYKLARFDKKGDATLFEKSVRDLYGNFREGFYSGLKPLGPEMVKTKKFMDTLGDLERRVNEVNPETFVREMFSWDAVHKQSNLEALREAETILGTNGKLEADIRRVAAKRQWSDADRGTAHHVTDAIRKVGLVMAGSRPVGKYAQLGGRPLAAATAYMMEPSHKNTGITSKYPGVYVSDRR